MNELVMAIDPDLHKNGVAMIENGKLLKVESLYLWDLISIIVHSAFYCGEFGDKFHVIIEDGNLGRSANWHGGGKRTAGNVGKNQAIATILRELCECHNISHECIKPHGYSKVFRDENIFKQATGWMGRTNEDSRAAVAIGFRFVK